MVTLTELKTYEDENGNTIEFKGLLNKDVLVTFKGKNNKLVIDEGFRTAKLTVNFDCNNATCMIGKNTFRGFIRLGEKCQVSIGAKVTCTENTYMSTAEHASITIGDDCMIASGNQIRADDAHPIFDVETGKRINMPKSIRIGSHVWIGARAIVLGGATIGDGSIVGIGSIVKGRFPNNCILAGAPAKIIRKNVAWERPHLSITAPYYKPDASFVERSAFWNMTEEQNPTAPS